MIWTADRAPAGEAQEYKRYHAAVWPEVLAALREWWDIMDPMQLPPEGREPRSWWGNMEEVFHTD